jgi:hypothetical protein
MGYPCIGLGERAAVRKAALRTIVSAIGDDRGMPFRQPRPNMERDRTTYRKDHGFIIMMESKLPFAG